MMKRLTFLSVLVILMVALVSNLAVPIPSASENDLPRGLIGDSPNELPIPVIDVMLRLTQLQDGNGSPAYMSPLRSTVLTIILLQSPPENLIPGRSCTILSLLIWCR